MSAPAPVRVRARELYFKSGGARLAFRTWDPAAPAGTIVLLHGLGEHAGRHAALGAALRAAGFAAAAYDLRGHGRSSGARGHVEAFADHVADLEVFLRVLADQGWPAPAFLLGQGLGGLVAVHHLLRGEEAACKGAVLASPALRLRFPPGRGRLALARLLDRAAPRLPLPSDIRAQHLTRDPRAVSERMRDPLVHGRTTARAFLATVAAMDEALRRAPEMRRPILVLGAFDDAVVSPQAMRELVERSGSRDRRLQLYPRLAHDLFHEPERSVVIEEVEAWLRERA